MIQPYISIIIPTYNRENMLSLTLDSFVSQDYPLDFFEIIVANNNSSDNTQNIIDKYVDKHENIKTIFEKRQGVHYARNSSAKIAKGEILYFTDDDMVADRNLLTELVKVFDLDPLIGSATGKIVGIFEVPPPHWVRKYMINGLLSLTEENKSEDLIVTTNDCVFSCHQAVRRDVFFDCGGFNPENTAGVWLGDGETGLGIKIKKRGYKFAYTSRSIIGHLIPNSRTTCKYLMMRLGNQGYCDSYTEYREHRERKKILFIMFKRTILLMPLDIARVVVQCAILKNSPRFIPAKLMYYYNRIKYDIKLFSHKSFREIVEIDDWVNHEITLLFSSNNWRL